jgi:DNA polymerase-3 subunit gamma/tau
MADAISFARKYRPKSLRDYIGNSAVKDTVRRYLGNGRPQTILLTGNSGCGKTSLARLLLKEYMCLDRDPKTGACGVCESCMAFDEYIETGNTDGLYDVYEIDASDTSGKKDIDAMLSGVEYPPTSGDWKGYIIDEVHLLSKGAMGRLLKSVEEPPEGVVMIFCTTNPESLLDTIKNRCQLKLPITKPSASDIVNLLERVCLNESKEYDKSGLRMIATRSENVVRDALNNVERVLTTRGSATSDCVSAEFREVSENLIFQFYETYLKKDYLGYINLLYSVKTSFSFEQFVSSVTRFTVRGIYILNGVNVEGLSKDELESYMDLFNKISPAKISLILASLRRMSIGDVEANLMGFIYSEDESFKSPEETTSVVVTPAVGVPMEAKHRNSNLQRIEDAKLQKGAGAVGSHMQEVGFSGLSNFFNMEKVT